MIQLSKSQLQQENTLNIKCIYIISINPLNPLEFLLTSAHVIRGWFISYRISKLQFFITCAKCDFLDGKHVVFGKSFTCALEIKIFNFLPVIISFLYTIFPHFDLQMSMSVILLFSHPQNSHTLYMCTLASVYTCN